MLSPIPFLFLIGLQTPVYTAGMIFLLLENHKILLDLHYSERNNRKMAHHDLLTGLPKHAIGDAVLVAVANRLRASVRDADFVCRLGGDEFVVLLPSITDNEAADVGGRIIATVPEPFEFAPGARVGAGIGLASAPRHGDTADELLSTADRAMYDAKRRGKGLCRWP
jgi:predicted signal transduction protein with EAL and GGDEF domain